MSADLTSPSSSIPVPGSPPELVCDVDIPEEGVRGWLVVDRVIDGMSFGGFRISPGVNRDEVEGLARAMSWKLGCHGSPVGGAKGGLVADPTDPDTPRKLAVFADACRDPLSTLAMVGKDMGATDALIDGLYASLGIPQMTIVQRRHGSGRVPDRLRDQGGYRRHMTGLGVAWAARAAMGGSLEGCRVGIQGWGLVGAGTAIRAGELGAQVVAISDAAGSIRLNSGTRPADLVAATAAKGVIPAEAAGHRDERSALFDAEVDLLVLAASSHSVDLAAAEAIQARVVVEGSNFGLTPEARARLHERGIPVIPDVVASSSSAAMVTRQMAAGSSLTQEELWTAIETSIDQATRSTLRLAEDRGLEPRDAYLSWLQGP